MKARQALDARVLTDIPNVGPSIAADFTLLGITRPANLRGKDPFVLFEKLCALKKSRQDPCVLDVFMAAVDFMGGAPARPWWAYTKERKKKHPDL